MYPQQQQQQQQQYPYNPNYGPHSGSGYPPQSNIPPPAGTFYHQQPGGPVNLNMPPSPPDNSSSGGWGEPSGLFVEKEVRQAFVSKVYSILTVQLVLTSILIGAFVLNAQTKMYFATSQVWIWLGFGIFLVSYMILVCVESARRSTPINFILMNFTTLGYGLVAAITSCRYDTQIVLYAFLATGVSCFLIALFAKTTKLDMTGCGTVLCLISLAQLVIGLLLVAILGPSAITSILLSVGGAFIASLYLIFDLQLIMGGRKCELSPEEYILGVIMLYTDVIMIFLYLLEIFNQLSKD